MSIDILQRKNTRIVTGAKDWKDAIRISVAPLVEQGFVKSCYSDAIIANVEKLGAYFLLAPGVAMPHARPEQGIIDTQISLTLFREPVRFIGKEEDTSLFITLAAADNEKHIDAMSAIAAALADETKIDKLCNAKDAETLYTIFQGGNEE